MGLQLMLQHFQALQSDAEREPFANQIAAVFCSMAEVYLTDLWYVQYIAECAGMQALTSASHAPNAETECSQLVGMALKYAPNSPEPLQLLCNLRISQKQNGEALAALQRRCVCVWVLDALITDIQ